MADGMSIRWLDVIALCYIFFQLTYAKAVVEVDLERFETLPSECCGGRTWTPFGSNCNGCEHPYFTVCLQHIPDGNNKCITTSQKQNRNSIELGSGNIHPSSVFLDLSDWKGSLLVEIDVKDHNNNTGDDDIDTMSYLVKQLHGTESNHVTMNGTRTSLTIAIRIYCKHGYFGPRCDLHCENGTNYICSPTGMRICNTGVTGSNCDQIVHEPPTTNTPNTKAVVSNTYMEIVARTIIPEATQESLQLETTPVASMVSTDRKGNGLEMYSTPSPAADHSVGSRSVAGRIGTRNQNPVRVMTTYRPVNPQKVKIPEPIENFSCNLMIDGHIAGAHAQVVAAISAALKFGPKPQVTVSVISSTFVVLDSGKQVTDIAYVVVMDNGNVLTRVEVSETLTSTSGQSALASELSNKNLRQHSSVSPEPKAWVKVHLPFIVVIACVAAIILMVPVIACIINSRRNARSGFKKCSIKSENSHKSRGKSTKETCIQFDTPYVLDNPMYDFSFDHLQLQPGMSPDK